MKDKKTNRILILFVLMQTLAIVAMAIASWQMVVLSQKIAQRDNIRALKTLTESYAITVKAVSENYEESQRAVHKAHSALEKTLKKLHRLFKEKIVRKILGKHACKDIEEALQKTIASLETYEQKTQPAMLKSLQKTEKTLQKLSTQLDEEQGGFQYLPWYIAGILASIVIILFFNSAFLVYIYKQQPAQV